MTRPKARHFRHQSRILHQNKSLPADTETTGWSLLAVLCLRGGGGDGNGSGARGKHIVPATLFWIKNGHEEAWNSGESVICWDRWVTKADKPIKLWFLSNYWVFGFFHVMRSTSVVVLAFYVLDITLECTVCGTRRWRRSGNHVLQMGLLVEQGDAPAA